MKTRIHRWGAWLLTLALLLGLFSVAGPAALAAPELGQHQTFENAGFAYPSQPSDYATYAQYKSSRKAAQVHDTEFFYDADTDTYYYYVTNSSDIYKSTDLLHWEKLSTNRLGRGWAPCIIKLKTPITYEGTEYSFAAYDATSSFGTRNSNMILYLSNSPEDGFVSAGTAIQSAVGDAYDFNAIDPKVLYDKDGNLWMSYGSWFGGIYVVALDPATGKPTEGALPGTRVCYRNVNHASIEGSNLIYNPDTEYYYLNVSYGSLDDTYNVRIGRSKSITGPYLDYNGQDLNNTTIPTAQSNAVGTKITSPYYFEQDTGWYSTGHSSFIYNSDTGEYFLSTNARARDIGGGTKLNVRKIYWTADGWPVVSPEMYAPEGFDAAQGEQAVPTVEIPGVYQFIELLRDDLPGTLSQVQRGNDVIVLEDDQTVTGAYTGAWAQIGENTVELLLGDVKYTVTVAAAWDWENGKETLVFTGLSEAGDCMDTRAGVAVWGKQMEAETMVQSSLDALSLQPTTRLDLVLPKPAYTGVNISWASNREDILSNEGKIVSRPEQNTTVKMTATLTLGTVTKTRDIDVLVFSKTVTEQEAPMASYDFASEAALLKDSAGSNDLTAEDTVTFTPSGLLQGGAAGFDSTGVFNVPTGLFDAEDFTLDVWVKLQTNASDKPVFSLTGGNGESMELTLKNGTGALSLSASANTMTASVSSSDGTGPVLNTWAKVTVTLAGNTASLYLDGELVGQSETFLLDPADIAATAAKLGSETTLLDQVRLYNRALSAQEILSDYSAMASSGAVRMTQDTLNISVGGTAAVPAVVYTFPDRVSSAALAYSSSNESVATVDSAGKITGIAAGTAEITAADSAYGSAAVAVNVSATATPATGITLSQSNLTGKEFTSAQLTATVTPTGATDVQVVWSSSDPTVAAVSPLGLVTLKKAGEATITATVKGTQVSADCQVTVTSSLLVQYQFDGNMDDSSPNGTAVRAANGEYGYSTGATGKAGDRALQILSKGTGTDKVVRLQNGLLNNSNNTRYTVSAWVKPYTLNAHTAVFFAQGRSAWGTLVPCSADNGAPTFRFRSDGNNTWTDALAPENQKLSLNAWSLLTMTYDNGTSRLYIDGKLVSSRSDSFQVMNNNNSNAFYIGGNAWDAIFDGLIDDFRLYDVALPGEDIAAMYQEVASQWSTGPAPGITYTVTFDSKGGSAVSGKTVSQNGTLTAPADPTRAGYIFTGWYTDEACTVKYDFTAKVTKSFTLYAGWEKQNSTFTDVKEADWFFEAVEYVNAGGLMTGTSDQTFSPKLPTSRAMFATILYRLAGSPAVSGSAGFEDVEPGQWYSDAIAWAAEKGIITGYSDTEFGPTDDVTRQQLAVMLHRFAKATGQDVSKRADLSGYRDAGEIAGWALEAMEWAVAEGLISGRGNGVLDPAGPAQRCEVAAILMRYLEK